MTILACILLAFITAPIWFPLLMLAFSGLVIFFSYLLFVIVGSFLLALVPFGRAEIVQNNNKFTIRLKRKSKVRW